ncbi:hypothetical protein [Pseudoalteromonas luteoviolacea]|uniref:Uncharacterized protein n=1 Tax=Pseudoalteromonas luteoviolacea S4060-1 TaxID=1365257 RepID=A0A167P9C1_9GAMM|nr:hypothetical protein [Pseudoalteromonas luteoviolacea]KZN69807.1 hypothetical protein N478_09935 [Pseudoalteromonas luteoviolacea S4060-1]
MFKFGRYQDASRLDSHTKVLGLHQGELVQLAKYNMTKFTKEQDSQHFSFHHQACGFVSTNGAYELSVILYEEHIEEPLGWETACLCPNHHCLYFHR